MGLRAAAFLTAGSASVPFWKFVVADAGAALFGVPLVFGLANFFTDRSKPSWPMCIAQSAGSGSPASWRLRRYWSAACGDGIVASARSAWTRSVRWYICRRRMSVRDGEKDERKSTSLLPSP